MYEDLSETGIIRQGALHLESVGQGEEELMKNSRCVLSKVCRTMEDVLLYYIVKIIQSMDGMTMII